MKRLLSLTLAIVLAAAAFAAEKATVSFKVNPAMTCQNCENKIKTNLRYEKGVKAITTSLADQTVTINYDAEKTNPANLMAALKKIGYTATATQAPAGCKKPCDKAGNDCHKMGGCHKKGGCDKKSGCTKGSCDEKSECAKTKQKCPNK